LPARDLALAPLDAAVAPRLTALDQANVGEVIAWRNVVWGLADGTHPFGRLAAVPGESDYVP
jgi:hypothetical protein